MALLLVAIVLGFLSYGLIENHFIEHISLLTWKGIYTLRLLVTIELVVSLAAFPLLLAFENVGSDLLFASIAVIGIVVSLLFRLTNVCFDMSRKPVSLEGEWTFDQKGAYGTWYFLRHVDEKKKKYELRVSRRILQEMGVWYGNAHFDPRAIPPLPLKVVFLPETNVVVWAKRTD